MCSRADQPPSARFGDLCEVLSHEHICKLRLGVRRVRTIPTGELKVSEMDRTEVCCAAGHSRYTRFLCREQQRQQKVRQCERSEIIASELQLKSVGRGHSGVRGHDTGIVDEHID